MSKKPCASCGGSQQIIAPISFQDVPCPECWDLDPDRAEILAEASLRILKRMPVAPDDAKTAVARDAAMQQDLVLLARIHADAVRRIGGAT